MHLSGFHQTNADNDPFFNNSVLIMRKLKPNDFLFLIPNLYP